LNVNRTLLIPFIIEKSLGNILTIVSRLLYVILAAIGITVFNLAGIIAIAVKVTTFFALKKVADYSTESSGNLIKRYNFPLFSRSKIFSEKRLMQELDRKKMEIESKLTEKIQNEFETSGKTSDIVDNIRTSFNQRANEASVLIR